MATTVPDNPFDVTQQPKFSGFGDVTGQITGGARNGTNWDFMDQRGNVLTSIPYQDYVDNYMASSGAVRQGINSVNGVPVFDFNAPRAAAPMAISPGIIQAAQPTVMQPTAQPASAGQGLVGAAINNTTTGQSAMQTAAPQLAGLPPMMTPQTYTPQTAQVDRATETAAGQVESMLANDNPLLQRARTIARQNMAQRGLVNSSMAQGAGVAAMMDRITPIAQQDAQTYSTRTLANMAAMNEAGQFSAGEANKFALQRSDQTFTADQNQAQRNFAAAQAELERAQQTALADKSIAAQQALQTAQQNFQAAQADLDRIQQKNIQDSQQRFAAAQADLDRAQQVLIADKSAAAQQALQKAQQEFAAAQANLDRTLQTQLADKNLAANQAQLTAQQNFAAAQAALDRNQQSTLQAANQSFQAQQTSLEIASRNSANASAFINRTIDQANASINAIIADGNLTPEAKKAAIQNLVDTTNSSLRWAATFYNTTVPGFTAPGGAASILNPGAGAGGGNAPTGSSSSTSSSNSNSSNSSTGSSSTSTGLNSSNSSSTSNTGNTGSSSTTGNNTSSSNNTSSASSTDTGNTGSTGSTSSNTNSTDTGTTGNTGGTSQYSDSQVAAAIQQSMAQGFSLEQSANAAASVYGVPADQLARVTSALVDSGQEDQYGSNRGGLIGNNIYEP